MRVFASVLLAVSSVIAYQVTYPGGEDQNWNTEGPNVLEWKRVDTDPEGFTAVLTNVDYAYDKIMNAWVDGNLGKVVCNPPEGGWPTGSGFRVNLAQDADHPDSLLAQSGEFEIYEA